MFEPSLILLLLKTVAIFLLCTLSGWSLNYRRLTELSLVNWVVYTVLGAALLNFVTIWAALLGFPGWAGLPLVGILVAVKLILTLRTGFGAFWASASEIRSVIWPILLLSSLSSLNYLAPLLAEGTSGYYSRGGGDHSTYLVLSEWFSQNSLWDREAEPATIPPQRQWEVNQFIDTKSNFNPGNTQPLANQFIATPFMSILPGANEETYSASVAFYISMAIWSAVALLQVILRAGKIWWPSFIPLFLSNLILYAGSAHSIPFIFSIAMINAALILYWIYTKNKLWTYDIKYHGYFLPLGLIHAALLAIYPHGFILLAIFTGCMALGTGSWERFRRFIILGTRSLIFSFAAVNFLLLTNIPLIFTGLGFSDGITQEYHLLNFISSLTGAWDFLHWYPNINEPQTWSYVGLALFLPYLLLSRKGFSSTLKPARVLLSALIFVPLVGIVYYSIRGEGAYQIVRFSEMGHLYFLALAGFGASMIIRSKVRNVIWAGYAALCLVTLPSIIIRVQNIQDVLNIDPVFATEFRDSKALVAVNKIKLLQDTSKGALPNRVAYYIGPGDGVDFAGGSVLLRNLHYMPARGNTLSSWFERYLPGTNTRAWKKEWLDNAFLVIRPEGPKDIIEDLRPGAFSVAMLDTPRLKIFDTSIQPATQLIGDSWNKTLFYSDGSPESPRPYRFLRKKPATVVVWTQRVQKVDLSFFMNADAPNSRVQIKSKLFGNNAKSVDVPMWNHRVPDSPTINFQVNLKPGANVFLVSPKRDDAPAPWLYVWKIRVKESD